MFSLDKVLVAVFFLILVLSVSFFFLPQGRTYTNPAPVDLLTVENFAALAASAVSSPTPGTVLNNGDLGVTGAGCTDFPAPCTTPGANGTVNNGAIQISNAVATTGQTDATAVVVDLNGRTPDETLAPQLGGLTLDQGVYEVSADATNLTGTLTLAGDADSIFIFQMTSTLITDGGSNVVLTGGVQACNVFWTVGSSATFNDDTEFVGTVLAADSVTFPGGGATLEGRVIAQTAGITFNNTTVNNTSCASVQAPVSSDEGTDQAVFRDTNVFHPQTSCPAVVPEAPQWATRQQVEGGVNLLWSAMGGSAVDIEISNAEGEFEFRYSAVPNTGHMFLPGVSSSQMIRIRVVNDCEVGDWLVVTSGPGLPAAGLDPSFEGNLFQRIWNETIAFSSSLLRWVHWM